MTVESPQPTLPELRHSPRYEPTEQDRLRVNARSPDQEESVEGQILDLSLGGAKLSLPTNFLIHSEILVTITSAAPPIEKRCRVCWSRPSRQDWWVGVAFKEELPDRQFNMLAAGGFIERRRDARIEHSANMTARWELGSAPIPVELVDLSSGGFKITTPEPPEVGKRVLIETEGNPGSPIVAKVQWHHATDVGFEVGCAFIDKNGCRNLMKQLGIHRPVMLTLPKLPKHSTRRLIALTVGVATVAATGFLLTNKVTSQALGAFLENYR